MYGIAIEVHSGDVMAALSRVETGAQFRQVVNIIGRAGVNHMRDHLRAYNDAHPNAMGWPRSNFFAAAARATNYRLGANSVDLTVSHTGIAQRYYGGEIKPVNAKVLALPAVAEAYGRRPGEFNNLELVGSRKHGFLALVERQSDAISYGRRRKDGSRKIKQGKKLGGRIMYWLVPKVTQKGDPAVLPTPEALGGAIRERMSEYLTLLASREQ